MGLGPDQLGHQTPQGQDARNTTTVGTEEERGAVSQQAPTRGLHLS